MIYWVKGFLFVLIISLTMVSSPLVLILLLITILISLVILLSFMMNCYFYSYVVFLLFVSGLMVLFMYVGSIMLNEKIYIKFNLIFYVGLLVWGLLFSTWESNLADSTETLFELLGLIKFFAFSVNFFSCFFFLYLLICLMVAYEIVKKTRGPMRMKF